MSFYVKIFIYFYYVFLQVAIFQYFKKMFIFEA
ncbi:MAG: hypothetical protein H6Q20_1353 [Bacteroidetes bacterium]|nr:hypothetical protein [Bacteroidota bacterium]